jgi:hypothetical protein
MAHPSHVNGLAGGDHVFTDWMIIMIYTSFNTVTARPGQFKFDKRERPQPRIY